MLGARDRRGSARRQPGLDFRQVPDDGRRGNSPRCSRGGFSTKIHLRTNANGEPLTFDVTGGEAHEVKGYEALIELHDVAEVQAWLASRLRADRARPASRGRIVFDQWPPLA